MASLSVLNILRAIKDRGSVSRTELQQSTGLSWGTITNTTRELLNRNLIREQGAQSTKAGRKPVVLAINPPSHALIGVELAPQIVRAAVLNLAGETLAYEEFTFTVAESPEAVVDRIGQLLQRLLDLPIIAARTCLGVGVAVPGYLDEGRSVLKSCPRMPAWSDMPIRQRLQDAIGPQVRLERDHNALALAERWFGQATQADDVLCINLSEDVGLGILSGGEVFRGSQQLAGEFGHLTVDPAGPACGCGDHGCVAAYASIKAVREYVHSGQENGIGTLTIGEIAVAAGRDHKQARDAFTRLGFHLGIGLANLIDLFNPHLIVLAGPTTAASEFFMPALLEQVEKHVSSPASRRVEVSRLGVSGSAMGGCGIVLQSVFEPSQTAQTELARV